MYNPGMKPSLKTRFAPSPTGLMHFGNLRTALFNYLYAERFQGIFLLRIEDTDTARSEQIFSEAIKQDLSWLGLEWQEGPFFQSERQAIYQEYYEQLVQSRRVYPCFCTEEELAITRKVQMAAHQPPRYPGTCRRLSQAEIELRQSRGMPSTLRFEVSDGQTIGFEDVIKGKQQFDSSHIGDFIIRRQDGSASFMFCNAIDDALMGVTHALRGDDHLTNTPRQILILQALGLSIPHYGHFPTILGPDSRPLSKRNGSRSLQELRENGFLPLGILNYLSRLGHHDPDLSLLSLATLAEHFDLARISSSPAHYDVAQLNHWQKEAMHHCSWETCWDLLPDTVKKRVPPNPELRQKFIEAIQPNLVMPAEALPLAEAIFNEKLSFSPAISKVLEEAGVEFFNVALKYLEEDLEVTYSSLITHLQQITGLKGKALFFPLRAALMGDLHGPEIAKILDLMGQEKVKSRFREVIVLLKESKHATNL